MLVIARTCASDGQPLVHTARWELEVAFAGVRHSGNCMTFVWVSRGFSGQWPGPSRRAGRMQTTWTLQGRDFGAFVCALLAEKPAEEASLFPDDPSSPQLECLAFVGKVRQGIASTCG